MFGTVGALDLSFITLVRAHVFRRVEFAHHWSKSSCVRGPSDLMARFFMEVG